MTNMEQVLSFGLIAGLGAVIASCGGGGGSSACTDVAACGGNVVGNWKINGTCFNTGNAVMASGLSSTCPSARTGNTNVTATGTVSYKADRTFTQTTTTSGSVSVVLPASCLMQMGVTITCDQLNQVFKSTLANSGSAGASGGIPNISCSNAGGGGCSCTTSIPSQTSMTSGTYSTSGSVLTQNGSSDDYCVQGDKLYLRPHQGMGMTATMGTVNVNGQIELQKQ
jgi:hypothetical protein